MKKHVQFLIAAVMVAQVTTVYGQGAVGGIVPIVGKGGGNVLAASGDYNINQVAQDNTTLVTQIIESQKVAAKEDREYLKSLTDNMNAKLKDLNALRTKLYNMSIATSLVDFEEYLKIVKEVNEKNQALVIDLETATLLTRESLPSFDVTKAGNLSVQVGIAGNLNMTPLVTKVNGMRQALYDNMNNMKLTRLIFKKTNKPVRIEANALNPDFSGMRILSVDEIKEMNTKIADLYAVGEEVEALQQRMVDEAVNAINAFVSRYGTTEWLRFNDDNDGKALKASFLRITDAFAMRSYLRKKTGFRMGAIQSSGYPKALLNTEKYRLQLQPLKAAASSFRREAALTDEQLDAAFDAARRFVQMYDEKVTPVFQTRKTIMQKGDKQMEYSSQDTGFLVKINSSLTFLTGQRQTAEILLSVMRLVLSDIQEEKMLAMKMNEEMISYSDAKNRSTDELKLANNRRICQLDFTLSQAAHDANCVKIGITKKATRMAGGNGTGLVETFGGILYQYETVEKVKRQEAKNLEALILAATQEDLSAAEKAAKEEEDNSLFR